MIKELSLAVGSVVSFKSITELKKDGIWLANCEGSQHMINKQVGGSNSDMREMYLRFTEGCESVTVLSSSPTHVHLKGIYYTWDKRFFTHTKKRILSCGRRC